MNLKIFLLNYFKNNHHHGAPVAVHASESHHISLHPSLLPRHGHACRCDLHRSRWRHNGKLLLLVILALTAKISHHGDAIIVFDGDGNELTQPAAPPWPPPPWPPPGATGWALAIVSCMQPSLGRRWPIAELTVTQEATVAPTWYCPMMSMPLVSWQTRPRLSLANNPPPCLHHLTAVNVEHYYWLIHQSRPVLYFYCSRKQSRYFYCSETTWH